MLCFAVRIFSRVGTYVGKFLVYLLASTLFNVINNKTLLNVIKRDISGDANDCVSSYCGKGIISFYRAFCQGKNELFRTRHAGRNPNLKHWNCQGLSLLCVVNNCHKDFLSSASGTLARACSIFSNCSGVTWGVLPRVESSFGVFEFEDPSSVS